MDTYPRASIVNRSGKKGWYVCVTVPPELRSLFPSKQIYKKIKGAETKQDAWDNYKKYEAIIWIEFDRANLANHPLPKAANALQEMLKDGVQWEPKDWFDPVVRWDAEDDVRSRAGKAIATFNKIGKQETTTDRVATTLTELDLPYLSPEDIKQDLIEVAEYEQELVDSANTTLEAIIRTLYDTFRAEFRKISEENIVPKKRGKLFIEVAQEYHQSSLFLRNRKNNELKRKRTTNKEKRSVERFLRWVNPAITVDEFGHKLATSYMEALANPTSGLIEKHHGNAPSNETVADNISAIKNVLNWAVRNEYIISSPWADVTVAGYGEPKKSYRDWTEDELRQVFSQDMPPQDFLCLAILACTGARLDEIALMRWDQFENGLTKDGKTVHWVDVTDAIVKNRPSRRLIPILPRVAELIKNHPRGLNKKDPDRLFTWPTDADGKAENKASRDLMKHLRNVSTDDNFAVHGLRHTVTTMCRVVRMDWEMREFMLGRGGSGEGANYGKAVRVEEYLDEMRNFDISFLDGQRAITKQKQITKQ